VTEAQTEGSEKHRTEGEGASRKQTGDGVGAASGEIEHRCGEDGSQTERGTAKRNRKRKDARDKGMGTDRQKKHCRMSLASITGCSDTRPCFHSGTRHSIPPATQSEQQLHAAQTVRRKDDEPDRRTRRKGRLRRKIESR